MSILNWECFDNYYRRAKVFGGWLVIHDSDVSHQTDRGIESGWDWRPAMCFVPDANYEWRLEEVEG